MKNLPVFPLLIAVSTLGLSAPTFAAGEGSGDGSPSSTTTPATTAPEAKPGFAAKVSEGASDVALTTKVKTALAAHAGLKTVILNVTSDKGTVTVTGHVKSQEISDKVTQVVQGVKGVKTVSNQLVVGDATPQATHSGY